MVQAFFLMFSFAGGALLLWRMWPRPARASSPARAPWPTVSIIVPARNEAHNLPALLGSLAALDYPAYEVIVVDDQSEDGTRRVASRFAGVRIVAGEPRPMGWAGKQWACQQGARAARGELLLFTDADTTHLPDGLTRMVAFLAQENADLASTFPWHEGRTWWERAMGPFHVLLLALTRPYDVPREKKLFAIGQYLLFRRQAYEALGGHAAVRQSFVEDLPLANLVVRQGKTYRVHWGPPVFKVRMYETFADFVAGWRRNFRAGMGDGHAWAGIEAAAFVAALTGAGQVFFQPWAWVPIVVSAAFLMVRQKSLGNFSWWGAGLFPFSLGLFCAVSALAAGDKLFRRDLRWKGRHYAAASPPPRASAVDSAPSGR